MRFFFFCLVCFSLSHLSWLVHGSANFITHLVRFLANASFKQNRTYTTKALYSKDIELWKSGKQSKPCADEEKDERPKINSNLPPKISPTGKQSR